MTDKYVRPEAIPPNMGGKDDELDKRLLEIIELMEQAPLNQVETLLDIGLGAGQLSKWLARKGKQVTGTALEISSYEVDVERLRNRFRIRIEDCSAENMPFSDESFDAVVMSHVLEHCPNVQMALREVYRVLKDGGYLFVFVPPHADYVYAGHVSVGWNVGQLMYVLLLAGFDVRNGRFIHYGENICGFARKNASLTLPLLRGDRGDIHILSSHGLFPSPVISRDGFNDGFWGNIQAINWDPEHARQLFSRRDVSGKARFAEIIARLLPGRIRGKLGSLFVALGNVLMRTASVNPDHLRG